MTNCPKCGRPVEKELICRWCAHVLHQAVDPRPEASVTTVKFEPRLQPIVAPGPQPIVAPPPQPIVAPPPRAAAAARPKQSRWSPRLIALVAGGVGLLALLAAVTRSPATTPLTATPAASPVKAARVNPAATGGDDSAAPVAPLRSDSAPRWIESGPDDRRRTGVNGFVFELSADEDVKVSRKRVRPLLTVRCAAKKTEVFVVTRSPASIESTGKHTIHVAFDGGDEDTQTWEHSVDHDALFAPDGHTLAGQIVGAHSMSFAFTPFNSPLAIATFSVAGFNIEVESAAKKCGWK